MKLFASFSAHACPLLLLLLLLMEVVVVVVVLLLLLLLLLVETAVVVAAACLPLVKLVRLCVCFRPGSGDSHPAAGV